MATNKECVILIVDVRHNATEEFKLKALKCMGEAIKHKISTSRKDYVGVVLLGTRKTLNDVNANIDKDSYLNIMQYDQVQSPDWDYLMKLYKFVNEEACAKGEWLDAIVVAMEMIKNAEDYLKFHQSRIILFHDFDGHCKSFDMFNIITQKLLECEINLLIVSSNIGFIDDDTKSEPKPVFISQNQTSDQLENEKYALQLVSYANAKVRNFCDALQEIYTIPHKKPWTWNVELSIGTVIIIKVSGFIKYKNDKSLELKKCWAEPEEEVTRKKEYFLKYDSDKPLDEKDIAELIDGYMLGGTPVPYDETLHKKPEREKPGLKFIGFTKRSSVPEEYFCGDSTYWIIHQKGMNASAKMIDALVRAMLKLDMVMLCWKIYSVTFNEPKLVCLLPNEFISDNPATLRMMELSYNNQHLFWEFPKLQTSKTECTQEQFDAIDDLIKAMDLTLPGEDPSNPRKHYQKELLHIDGLLNVYEQNMMDFMERKILSKAGETDEEFEKLIDDKKNFVEKYWKVPEEIEESAKKAVARVKELFPLEERSLPLIQARAKEAEAAAKFKEKQLLVKQAQTMVREVIPSVQLEFTMVGSFSPAQDFTELLKYNVMPVKDITLRDTKYHIYAAQMRTVICGLFEILTPPLAPEDSQKIFEALEVYRKSSYDFNAIDEYNDWIQQVKKIVMENKLQSFWKGFIVKNNLGICIVGVPTLEEKIELENFYRLEDDDEADETMHDDSFIDGLDFE